MAWDGVMEDLVTMYRSFYVECVSCGWHMIMDGDDIGRMTNYARRYFGFEAGDRLCRHCTRKYQRLFRRAKAIMMIWWMVINFEELRALW